MQQLLPPKLVAILLVVMVGASLIAPWPDVAWSVRVIGVLPLAAGLALNLRHANLFNSIGTNIKTFDDPDTLVEQGAFSWTRNPMYLGFTLMLVGSAVLLGSVVSFGGPIAFFGAANGWYIPFEERRMRATFGSDYETYRQHVRRWVGRRRSVA